MKASFPMLAHSLAAARRTAPLGVRALSAVTDLKAKKVR
jgi:hypothetical protein